MQPKPRLSEKNACPMAPITTGPVILPKSGLKRKRSPAPASGSISELMQKTTMRASSSGMSTLLIRSMPLATPREMIK